MKKIALFFVVAFLFNGCATIKKDRFSDNNTLKEMYLAHKCESYQTLAINAQFPLADLALLRAHQVCTDKTMLAPIENLSSKSQSLYQDLYLEVKYSEAQKTTLLKDDVEALLELARNQAFFKKREEYFQQALQLAQKNGDPDLIKITQEALERSSPRLKNISKSKLSNKELLTVAFDYRQWREYTKALQIYKKILKTKKITEDEEYQVLKNIRLTLKTMQNKKDYIKATQKIYNWTRSQWLQNKSDFSLTKRFHESATLLAKTLWTEDQTGHAKKIIFSTSKELKGHYPLEELYYIQARIADENKNFTQADEFYNLALKEKSMSSDTHNKILWARAWMNYKQSHLTETANLLTELVAQSQEPSDKARAMYWLGRTYAKQNKNKEAILIYNQLKQEDPLGYYGVLSLRELKEKIPTLTESSKNLSLDLNLQNTKSVPKETAETIDWLIAVDEKEFVEKALGNVVNSLRKNRVQSQDDWLKIFSTYAKAGLYLPLFSNLTTLPAELKDRLLQSHPDLLFPQPWKDLVSNSAQKQKIPFELIYAIMRQESSFNPQARSSVDAYGLLQLLPSVAKAHAIKNKVNYSQAEDLFEPEINIPVGASELAQLLNKYQHQFILAVAGYNASDNAIDGWLKRRFRPDPIEFIEEIPYEETRVYVKLVMRNFIFYRRLNLTQDFDFPEDELLQLRAKKGAQL